MTWVPSHGQSMGQPGVSTVSCGGGLIIWLVAALPPHPTPPPFVELPAPTGGVTASSVLTAGELHVCVCVWRAMCTGRVGGIRWGGLVGGSATCQGKISGQDLPTLNDGMWGCGPLPLPVRPCPRKCTRASLQVGAHHRQGVPRRSGGRCWRSSHRGRTSHTAATDGGRVGDDEASAPAAAPTTTTACTPPPPPDCGSPLLPCRCRSAPAHHPSLRPLLPPRSFRCTQVSPSTLAVSACQAGWSPMACTCRWGCLLGRAGLPRRPEAGAECHPALGVE